MFRLMVAGTRTRTLAMQGRSEGEPPRVSITKPLVCLGARARESGHNNSGLLAEVFGELTTWSHLGLRSGASRRLVCL